MTKDEQMRLCLMLAFQTVITQGRKAKPDETAEKIMGFARLLSFHTAALQDKDSKPDETIQKIIGFAQLIDEFCDLHLTQTFPAETIKLVEDKGASKIDTAINQHIEDLQKREQTDLPTERETLLQFYDRLQQRKTRRTQWLFYAQASAETLADLVLKYMDEEIEEKRTGGYQ